MGWIFEDIKKKKNENKKLLVTYPSAFVKSLQQPHFLTVRTLYLEVVKNEI